MISKQPIFNLKYPSILDEQSIMRMQQEFFNTNCKFNGTSNLDLFNNYIDWLANTINQSNNYKFNNTSCKKFTYLAIINKSLIGMVEIIAYTNPANQKSAHIIECIRPSCRRLGYGKPLIKQAIQECLSYGIRKDNITFERNNKASNGTMTKIMDF